MRVVVNPQPIRSQILSGASGKIAAMFFEAVDRTLG
jgi:hypothetical protein